MSSKTSVSSIACAPGALPGGLSRTRFFDGMFLTQADLENEQRFWRVKRRLTNRTLGDGVVWGLRLAWKPERRAFALGPGYALDCCGNDLIVECPLEIGERELWERSDPSLRSHGVKGPHNDAAAGRARSACVVLQYVECVEEVRPVHRDACAGPTGACEPSRVRETARLLLVPPPSPAPPSPPEQFWTELLAWRDTLPPAIRDLLFPPQAQPPPPQPQSGLVPAQVIVRVPGSPPASATLQPDLNAVVNHPGTLHGVQPWNQSRPTGVVTFELQPSAGWGFSAGQVLDGTRVVESVTPPMAPSMFWSFDVAVPPVGGHQAPVSVDFSFLVDRLAIDEMFGGGVHGEATFLVEGTIIAHAVTGPNGQQLVDVEVHKLRVTTRSSTVVAGGERPSCFEDVVPWGWAIDTADGSRIARVLVLASLYATLNELVQRGSAQVWRTIATWLYAAAWILLFGVNPLAQVDDSYRRELVGFLQNLFERWCAGFMYPGPRCGDEHHGVYLGCAQLSPTGAVLSFDPWEHRRHVLTGPLFTHWAGLFGIAAADVIVGRFAQAICCLAKQPPIALPTFGRGKGLDFGNRLSVGSPESINAFSKRTSVPVSWVTGRDLLPRVLATFVGGKTDGDQELLAVRLADGGSVAFAVPPLSGLNARPATNMKVSDDVAVVLRRGSLRVNARARVPLTALAVEVARETPVSAVLRSDASADATHLAGELDGRGVTMLALLEHGADASLAKLGLSAAAAAASRDDADLLVEHAEQALDGVIAAVAGLATPGLTRATLAQPEVAKKAVASLSEALGGKVSAEALNRAVRRAGES